MFKYFHALRPQSKSCIMTYIVFLLEYVVTRTQYTLVLTLKWCFKPYYHLEYNQLFELNYVGAVFTSVTSYKATLSITFISYNF